MTPPRERWPSLPRASPEVVAKSLPSFTASVAASWASGMAHWNCGSCCIGVVQRYLKWPFGGLSQAGHGDNFERHRFSSRFVLMVIRRDQIVYLYDMFLMSIYFEHDYCLHLYICAPKSLESGNSKLPWTQNQRKTQTFSFPLDAPFLLSRHQLSFGTAQSRHTSSAAWKCFSESLAVVVDFFPQERSVRGLVKHGWKMATSWWKYPTNALKRWDGSNNRWRCKFSNKSILDTDDTWCPCIAEWPGQHDTAAALGWHPKTVNIFVILTANPPTPLWRWRRAYWGATATLNAQWHLLIIIAVAISALAGGGAQRRFRTETSPWWCFRLFSRIFGYLSARGYWNGILGHFGSFPAREKRPKRKKTLYIARFCQNTL